MSTTDFKDKIANILRDHGQTLTRGKTDRPRFRSSAPDWVLRKPGDPGYDPPKTAPPGAQDGD